MNWTEILARAGIPEPIGREQAIDQVLHSINQRYEREGGPKRARGTNKRPQLQVSRKLLQERERKATR